jgi:hypothetical protein
MEAIHARLPEHSSCASEKRQLHPGSSTKGLRPTDNYRVKRQGVKGTNRDYRGGGTAVKHLISCLVVSCVLLQGSVAPAQPGSTLSVERRQRLDRVLQQYVDENRLPGAVALVLRDGSPVYQRAGSGGATRKPGGA